MSRPRISGAPDRGTVARCGARDVDLLDDALVHLAAVDVRVGFLSRRERKPDEDLIERRLRHPARRWLARWRSGALRLLRHDGSTREHDREKGC